MRTLPATSRNLSIEAIAFRLGVSVDAARRAIARVGIKPSVVNIDIRFDPSITEIVRNELTTNGDIDQ